MRFQVALWALVVFLAGVSAYSKVVRDWKDLDKTHHHLEAAKREMDHARQANHYDMQGHGAKAEELIHEALKEIEASIAAIKSQ